MKRILKWLGLSGLVLFVLIQVWPAGRTNPPVTGDLTAPPEVSRILRRSCYDCHSNETHWPWYAYVAPVSWLAVHDVDEGRRELNLSDWASMPEKRHKMAPQKMIDEIDSGAMPMPRYLWLHPDARLTPEEVETIRKWAEGPR